MTPLARRALRRTVTPLLAALLLLVGAAVAQAAPAVTTAGTGSTQMLGTDFVLPVTFDNTGSGPGFRPYVDVILDDGADGGATPDGLTLSSADSGAGATISTVACTGSTVTHPFALTNTGAARTLTAAECPAGSTLYAVQLAFGSFADAQPAASVNLHLHLSNLADLGVDQVVKFRGGFSLGADALDNPTTDAPIVEAGYHTANVTPSLVTVQKSFGVFNTVTNPGVCAEDETASGPNYRCRYLVQAKIAPGQTISSFDLRDVFPRDAVVTAIDHVSPAGGTASPATPFNVLGPTATSNVDVNWASVTGDGSATTVDASYEVEFWVPYTQSTPSVILPPAADNDQQRPNNVQLLGSWTPVDVRDAVTPVNENPAGPENVSEAEKLAVQKGCTILTDTGHAGLTPGDTLTCTMNAQVSDFSVVDNIEVDDHLGDGLLVDTGFVPTYVLTEQGATTGALPFTGAFYTHTDNVAGGVAYSDLQFHVSAQRLASAGSGKVYGGCVPKPAGSAAVGGNPAPNCARAIGQKSTLQITYHAVVQETFLDKPGQPDIGQNDTVTNTATITADTYDPAAPTGAANGVTDDDTAWSGQVTNGVLAKAVWAISRGGGAGVDPATLEIGVADGVPDVTPDDLVTYRLQYVMTESEVKQFSIDDYLPYPVYDTTGFNATAQAVAGCGSTRAAVPAEGRFCIGSNDNYLAATGGAPTATFGDPNNGNHLLFTLGNRDTGADNGSTTYTIDLLYTVRAQAKPMADNLPLVNQAHVHYVDTDANDVVDDQFANIRMHVPHLKIRKGIISTDNPTQAKLTPTTTTPPTFTPGTPGTGGSQPTFGGTVNNSNVATGFDSNLTVADRSDWVRFAYVVQNTGTSPRGAFDVRLHDTLPGTTNYQAPVNGTTLGTMNLHVWNGKGQLLTPGVDYVDNDGGAVDTTNLFNGYLELTDPDSAGLGCDATGGSIDSFLTATAGCNILVVTYDVQFKTTALNYSLNEVNTANITRYGAKDNIAPATEDYTLNPSTDLVDTATSQPAPDPIVAKTIVSTNQASTTGTDVVVGEKLQYQVTLQMKEGTTQNVQLADTLDAGLGLVSIDSITANPAISSSRGAFGTASNFYPTAGSLATAITTTDSQLHLNFGNVTNTDTSNATNELITVTYTAIVTNSASAFSTTAVGTSAHLNNAVAVTCTDCTTQNAAAPDVVVREPRLQVAKSETQTSGDAGDTINYTVVVSHNAAYSATDATAFDVDVSDTLPAGISGLTNVTCTSTATVVDGGPCNGGASNAAAALPDTIDQIPVGASVTYKFDAVVQNTAVAGNTLTNTAKALWTSLPGTIANQCGTNPVCVERTGNVADTGGAENDHVATGTSNFVMSTPSAAKTIVNREIAGAGGAGNVTIGEKVAYNVAVTVPAGTTNSYNFVDTLPGGLGLANTNLATESSVSFPATVTSTNGGADWCAAGGCTKSFAGAPVGGFTQTGGSDQVFTINLGTVTNTSGVAQVVNVQFIAVVVDRASNTANPVTTLTNSVATHYTTSAGVQNPAAVTSPAVTVVEPQLRLQKGISTSSGDAADALTYTVTLDHVPAATRDTTGYDVHVTDTLPAGLQNMTNIACAPAGGATGVSGCSVTAGTSVDVTVATLPVGGSVVITFDASVSDAAITGTTITNTANTNWTSIPGARATDLCNNATGANDYCIERSGTNTTPGTPNTYFTSAAIGFTVAAPAAVKSVVSRELGGAGAGPVQVGEKVRYRVRYTFPAGTSSAVDLVDTLDAGLGLDNAAYATDTLLTFPTGVTASGGAGWCTACSTDFSANPTAITSTDDQHFTVSLGTVLNSTGVAKTVDVEYTAVVLNSAATNAGTTWNNTAAVHYNASGVQTITTTPATPVTVVEPKLQVAKTRDIAGGQYGATIHYTLVLSHTAATNQGTAYEAHLTDTLPAGLVNLHNLVCTPSAGAGAVTGCTTGGASFDAVVATLPLGETLTATFDADVATSAVAGTTITNTASTTWTSIPGTRTTDLCTIGAAVCTERTGSILDPGGANNDFTNTASVGFAVDAPSATKTLVSTDQSSTTGSNVAVGEKVRYRVAITVPAGTTNAVNFTDAMQAGLGLDTAAYPTDTTVSFPANVMSSNWCPAGGCTTDFSAAPGGGLVVSSDQNFLVNLGNVVNSNASATAVIIVEYTAVVVNSAATNAGTSFQNGATFHYTSGTVQDAALPPVSVTVLEPQLRLDKAGTPATGDGGDSVTFTLVLDHVPAATSDTSAFDAHVTDTLPASFQNMHGLTCVGSNGATTVAGCTVTGGGTAVDTSIASLAPGETFTVTFLADVASSAVAGDTITNTANSTWTSIPGARATDLCTTAGGNPCVERTGVTGDQGGASNDYRATDTAPFTTNVPTAAKTLVSRELNRAGADNPVVVGEKVRYRVAVTVPAGTTNGVDVADVLSASLGFETANLAADTVVDFPTGVTSTNGGADWCAAAPCALTFADAPAGGLTRSDDRHLLVSLGQVVNTTGSTKVVTVEYTAIVADAVAVQAASTGSNAATVHYVTSGGTQAIVTTPPAAVTVKEPQLRLAKTSDTTNSDGAAPITYTLVLDHVPAATSDATAYDAHVTDFLPAGLENIHGATCVKTDATAVVSGCPADGSNSLDVIIDKLPVGQTLTVTFEADVAATAVAGNPIVNAANARWTSIPGARTTDLCTTGAVTCTERTGADGVGGTLDDYAATSNVTYTLNGPTAGKSIVSTELATAGATNPVVVGEKVRYRVAIAVPQGTTTAVGFDDLLPGSLGFETANLATDTSLTTPANVTITDGGGAADWCPSTAGCSTNFTNAAAATHVTRTDDQHMHVNLGTVVNNTLSIKTVNVEYTVVVVNAATVDAGDTAVNTAVVSYTDVGGPHTVSESAPAVTVTEPQLRVSKTSTTTTGDGGDTVHFVVTLDHVPAATNDATARDAHITDALTSDFTNLRNLTCTPAGGAAAATGCTVVGATSYDVVAPTVPIGGSMTLAFDATISTSAVAGTTLTNTADATWTSIPGARAADLCTTSTATTDQCVERTGTATDLGGAANDYDATDDHTLTMDQPTFAKTLTGTELGGAGSATAAPGEHVFYDVAATVPGGTTGNVVVTDTLDAGLAYVTPTAGATAHAQVTFPAGVTTSSATFAPCNAAHAAACTVAIPAAAITSETALSLALGTIINANDAATAVTVSLTTAVTNTVAPGPDNVRGTTHPNSAHLAWTTGGAGLDATSVDLTVAEPTLQVVKTITSHGAAPFVGLAGDVVTYQLVVSHTGASDATAYDVHVLDTLDARLVYQPAPARTCVGSDGTVTGITCNNADPVDVTIGVLPVGKTVTITYRAKVQDAPPVAVGTTIPNVADVTWTSTPGARATDECGAAGLDLCVERTGDTAAAGGAANTYADSDNVDFTVTTGSLSGTVWIDLDNDGVIDAGETDRLGSATAAQGVPITLTGHDHLGQVVNLTTYTDAAGNYTFTGLRPSDATGYTLHEGVVPATANGSVYPTLVDGQDVPGTGITGAGGSVDTDEHDDVVVVHFGSADTGIHFNFGELPPASIAGHVWQDSNDDAVRQGSEPLLAGVVVKLTCTDYTGLVSTLTTTTDAGGAWSFTGLEPGACHVDETQPVGYGDGRDVVGTIADVSGSGGTSATGAATGGDSFTGVTLLPGAAGTNYDFGELLPASLSGHVYWDRDLSTTRNADPAVDPPIAGVTVTLTGTDIHGQSVTRTTVTDATGAYTFTDLAPGTYVVHETQPSGYLDAGENLGTVSDRPGTPTPSGPGSVTADDTFGGIDLRLGADGVNYDFGEIRRGDLSIVKTASAARTIVGGQVTYTLAVHNAGPGPEPGVHVQDAVPGDLQFVSAATTQGTCTQLPTVDCELGTIGVDQTVAITVVVVATEAGVYTNTGVITRPTDDPDPTNDHSSTTTTVIDPTVGGRDCTVSGSAGHQTITGTPAHDVLCGGSGDDTIVAGPGDTVVGGGGNDTITVTCPSGTTLASPAGAVVGGDGSDTITVGCPNITINGGTGNDHIVVTGAGGNSVYGGDGNDTIVAGEATGPLLLCGNAGNDVITGGRGKDTLSGGTGNDTLAGGPGNDLAYGDAGADRVRGDAGNDELYGGVGNDRLDGGTGNDRVFGEAGNDDLTGGLGLDRLAGGIGNDVLRAKDKLVDQLRGDAGRDTAVTDAKDRVATVEIRTGK